MVLASIEANLKSNNFIFTQKQFPKADCYSEIIKKQIAREQQKLSRVKEAYAEGADTLKEYQANKQKILSQIKKLKSEKSLQNAQPQPAATGNFPAQQVEMVALLRSPKISAEQKNIVLRSFIDKIVFDREKNQVEIFYYL